MDRTDPKNKDKPINKLANIKNINVYWNHNETLFCKNLFDKKEPIEELLKNITNF